MAKRKRPVWFLTALLLALVALGLSVSFLAWQQWGGGRGDADQQADLDDDEKQVQQDEEAEKRKKLPYEIGSPTVQASSPDSARQFVKPGHWTTASQRMKANYTDFVGQSITTVVDKEDQPVALRLTPFYLTSTRPVTLIKARPKNIETTFFVPQEPNVRALMSTLRERNARVAGPPQRAPFTRMDSYQYKFVVLATEPNRYSYLKSVDAVKVPFDGLKEFDDTEDTIHYHILQPDISERIPLADNPLAWTAIAYILWDEVDPQMFSPTQQEALVDWLHWGGQLIVNGPDSLDLLAGSFLEDYLPAVNAGPREITADDLAELNRGWRVPLGRGEARALVPTVPWSGIHLDMHPDAQPLSSTGELLAERNIGRGRIVVSAMQLAERDLINWKNDGFDSLLNACLLRRPPRRYLAGPYGEATVVWADEALQDRRLDARLTTGIRFLARDEGVETNYREVEVDASTGQWAGAPGSEPIVEFQPPKYIGGVGAWNDFSATAEAARQTLREAAGVEVPGSSFVVFWLAAYLTVLVPLNALFFRALGRIEWAWVAAPIIAVLSTLIIVQRAQLDIGFVRSQTEIGLLELQTDHPRGHLSRYTSLYTSLSTAFDLQYDNLTTLAAPFPVGQNDPLLRGQEHSTVAYQRHENVKLTDLQVASASARWVHSEQMFPLDGAIQLGKSSRGHRQIENRSQLELKGVAIVRRPAPDERSPLGAPLEGAWVGDLLPGASAPVSFLPLTIDKDEVPFAVEREADARRQRDAPFPLDELLKLVCDPQRIEPGETRLVGRIDEILPGQTIAPSASQVRGATLVVAHLEYPPRPPAQPDANGLRDVVAVDRRPVEDIE